MPDRYVRAGILTSERVNSLSWAEEVFYRRLMSAVDDYGRFDARNAILRAELYPLKIDSVREADIATWKRCAAEAGLIVLYQVDGREFLQITNFRQRTRSPSKFPEPPPLTSADICQQVSDTRPQMDDIRRLNSRSRSRSNAQVEDEGDTPRKPPKGGSVADPYSAAFEAFWRCYPRHEGKGAAWKAWATAVKHVQSAKGLDPQMAEEWILNVAECFAASPKGRGEFCPHAATWLNQRRFDDDPADWNRSGSGTAARLNGPGVTFGANAEPSGGLRTDF